MYIHVINLSKILIIVFKSVEKVAGTLETQNCFNHTFL